MELLLKFYLINYTVNMCDSGDYVGVAIVSATSTKKAIDIFTGDSQFNGYELFIKITSILESPCPAFPNLNVEEYMRKNALEILRLNDIIVANGKSAYLIAVDNGYRGTEVLWLESLKGKDGKDGLSGNINYPTFKIDEGMYLIMNTDAASDEDRFYLDDSGNLILVI